MRILLDQNVPERFGRELAGHEVTHSFRLGWSGLANGELLDAAERGGFDLLLTADQSIRYQQNLAGRRLAIVVLRSNRLSALLQHVDLVRAALETASPGSVGEVEIPR